jgi:FkbM family methyltransferase
MFQSRVHFWKTKGLAPQTIYDIGANVGEWTQTMKGIFPNANYQLFEANRDNQKHIAHLNHHIVLLGDKNEENVPFYKIRNGYNTGDSMYLEVSSAFQNDNYTTTYLEKKRLDTYVLEKGLPLPDLVKIDVQGGEIDVLEGMGDLMGNVKHFIIEASLHRWNKDAPMVEDIIGFMYSRGYYFVDILETHVVDGYNLQIDILFSHASTNFRKENFYRT